MQPKPKEISTSKHKPIICRRCDKRMPDAEELPFTLRDPNVCHCCATKSTSLFTSRPQPIDLQWYDKNLK
jgi:ribosomal protein L24E